MKAILSIQNGEILLAVENSEEIFRSQGGLSPENIKEMLDALYKSRATQLVLRSQGGLSPENIKEMLDALYKMGNPPSEVLVTWPG